MILKYLLTQQEEISLICRRQAQCCDRLLVNKTLVWNENKVLKGFVLAEQGVFHF